MAPDEFVFLSFRLASALLVTGAAAYVAWALYHGKLKPLVVWRYTCAVLIVNTVWRWFIVWLLLEEQEPLWADLTAWVSPITQTMTSLLVMAIVVMTFTHLTSRARHYRDEHPDYE